jgi:hypothetical protein
MPKALLAVVVDDRAVRRQRLGQGRRARSVVAGDTGDEAGSPMPSGLNAITVPSADGAVLGNRSLLDGEAQGCVWPAARAASFIGRSLSARAAFVTTVDQRNRSPPGNTTGS